MNRDDCCPICGANQTNRQNFCGECGYAFIGFKSGEKQLLQTQFAVATSYCSRVNILDKPMLFSETGSSECLRSICVDFSRQCCPLCKCFPGSDYRVRSRIVSSCFGSGSAQKAKSNKNVILSNAIIHCKNLNESKRFNDCIEAAEKYIKKFPKHKHDFNLYIGKSHLDISKYMYSVGRMKQAKKENYLANNILSSIIQDQKEDKSFQAYYYLGLCYELDNRLKKAVLHYRRAIEIKPDYVNAIDRLNKLEIPINSPFCRDFNSRTSRKIQSLEAGNYLIFCQKLIENNRLEEGVHYAKKGLKKYPEKAAELYFIIGACHFKDSKNIEGYNKFKKAKKEAKKAENAFLNAIKRKKNHIKAYYYLGLSLEQQKRFADAFKNYEKLLQLDPTFNPAIERIKAIKSYL